MSLSLGQSPSYINKIENGKTFPSMQNFFYICEYLGISPGDFFDEGNKNPEIVEALVNDLKMLTESQLLNISDIVRDLKR